MKIITTALSELWGLFVDDGRLAIELLAWCLISIFLLPRWTVAQSWSGLILFVGCLLILLSSVVRAARRARALASPASKE